MDTLIDNLINGYLKDAKRMAKYHDHWEIREALIDNGYSPNKAVLTVDWLKGRDCWQAACDAA